MPGSSLVETVNRASRPFVQMLAAAALLIGAGPALAEPAAVTASADPAGCAGRYHAALVAIGQSDYRKIKAARTIAFKGDSSLPGTLIFPPPRRLRTAEEISILRQASALARRRGRATWIASADNRWIANRIVTELGEYLSQGESPYLCGGVSDYLETLRGFVRRIGPGSAVAVKPATVQRAAARRAIGQAFAAMRPVPKPRFAPASRGSDPLVGLRPSKNMDRVAAFLTPAAHSPRKRVYGPMIDPDLPPLAMAKAIPLATDDDRLAALGDLVAATKAAGLIDAAEPAEAMPKRSGTSSGGSEAGPPRPVLARLMELRPLGVGKNAAVRDPLVRRKLLAAFAAVEALDYLAHRPAGGDPMLAAIEATLGSIEAAHTKACDCAG